MDTEHTPRKKATEDDSAIEKTKRRLYDRNYTEEAPPIAPDLSPEDVDTPRDWQNEETPEAPDPTPEEGTMFKKIFIFSALFFVAALGIGAYLFFGGGNIVSSDNVNINIVGPVSVEGGDEVSLQVIVENNNNTALQSPDLIIEYPEGSHDTADIGTELTRQRISLDDIPSGEAGSTIIRSVIFGEEESERTTRIALEYRVAGSNAIWVKEKTHTVRITSAPVHVVVETLDETTSGQSVAVSVAVSSNSDSVIEDLLVRVDFPFGFEPGTAQPKPTYGNNLWRVGDIGPGDEALITFTGTLSGQDGEEKIFTAHVGKQDSRNEREIATVYNSTFKSTLIARPFLGVELTLMGERSEEYVVSPGQEVRGVLTWQNNAPAQINNASIELSFEGDALDQGSVSVDRGFYNSNANKVLWDQGVIPELAAVPPGGSGRVNFSFSSASLFGAGAQDLRNPEIKLTVNINGSQVSPGGTPSAISQAITRVVKINSAVDFSSRGVYYAGPFSNVGPLPPQVGQETTYTVIWSLVNTASDIRNGVVTATLPSYVVFKGATDPSGEEVSFNQSTGALTWRVGTVSAGTGVAGRAREVAFQIGFTPSISQVGTSPDLVRDARFTGLDDFTRRDVSDGGGTITTSLATDPTFNPTQAQVVQ